MSYCHETVCRLKFLTVYFDDGMYISPRVEIGDEFHRFWFQSAVEGIEDLIGGILVGDMAVHERVDIEFERFELYDLFVGNIGEFHRGKIGIARAWAEAHELWELYVDAVILFMFVGPEVLFRIDVELLYLFFSVFHFSPLIVCLNELLFCNGFADAKALQVVDIQGNKLFFLCFAVHPFGDGGDMKVF